MSEQMPLNTDTEHVIGVRHNTDGTSECVVSGDRCILRIDPSEDRLTIDPDVAIEGDATYGYRLSAPFTTSVILTERTSRIIVHGPIGTASVPTPVGPSLPDTWVDQHALLTHAVETGERVLRLSDFVVTTPGQSAQ